METDLMPLYEDVPQEKIDAFIEDVAAVYLKHGMCLDYVDTFNSFVVHTKFTPEDADEMRARYGRADGFHVSWSNPTRFHPQIDTSVADSVAHKVFNLSEFDRNKIIYTDDDAWTLDGDDSLYRGVIISWYGGERNERIIRFIDDLSRDQRESLILASEHDGTIELVWRDEPKIFRQVAVFGDCWHVKNSVMHSIKRGQSLVYYGRPNGHEE